MAGKCLCRAYETLKQDPCRADRALSRVLKGVSTRDYAGGFDEAGGEVGVSRSNVSREAVKAASEAFEELTTRKIATPYLAISIRCHPGGQGGRRHSGRATGPAP